MKRYCVVNSDEYGRNDISTVALAIDEDGEPHVFNSIGDACKAAITERKKVGGSVEVREYLGHLSDFDKKLCGHTVQKGDIDFDYFLGIHKIGDQVYKKFTY